MASDPSARPQAPAPSAAKRRAGIAVTVLLGLVVVFQLALIAGAPWGRWTQGGGADGALPASGRAFAAVSVVVLVVFWLGLAGRAGLGPSRGWPPRLLAVLSWIAVGYGVLAVLANAATPSGAERAVWLPFAVVLLALELVIAWPARRQSTPPA